MKTSELTGAALDWAVAKCEGLALHKDALLEGVRMDGWHASGYYMDANQWVRLGKLRYSTDWSLAGPIIEREEISVEFGRAEFKSPWIAYKLGLPHEDNPEGGPTPLIAAMRCYVASKLGDEVEVPDELA